MTVAFIIVLILSSFVVGAIARWAVPGPDPMGFLGTVALGFIGSLLGSLIGIIVMRARGGNMKMEIPFGVFLGPAALTALFVGKPLIDWYLGLSTR